MTTLRRRYWLGAALVLAAVGTAPLATADVRDLSGKLKAGVGAQDTDAVRQALLGLLELGGEDALESVLKMVAATGGGRGASATVYWQLVNGASGFQDERALAAFGEFVVKYSKKKAPFARDLVLGLENNASPAVTAALKPILEDGPYDLQLMAADQLGLVATTASVDALIAALEREGDKGDPALRKRIMNSLSTITRQEMGDALNWIGWWKANRDKGLPEPEDRSRPGQFASSTLNKDRGEQLESVVRNDPRRIVVISAKLPDDHKKEPNRDYNYDHMEQVLEGMKLPHTVVLKEHFNADPQKYLSEAWTVLVNCANVLDQCICKQCRIKVAEAQRKGQAGPTNNRMVSCATLCSVHDNVNYALNPEAIEALKRWVGDGGYLFTEDWGIKEVIEAAWPEKATKGPNVRKAQVAILPGSGMASRPILRGVFTRPRPPVREHEGDGSRVRAPLQDPTQPPQVKWQVDDESPAIAVTNEREVDLVMISDDLAKVTDGHKAVAISFRYGRGGKKSGARDRPVTGLSGKSRGKGAWSEDLPGGRVLHMMSHFGHQQGSQSDTFVLQNLILNFITESNREHQ